MSRLASGTSTHAIQIDDCYEGGLTENSEFHELTLSERPGRFRHSYIYQYGCIPKLYEYVKSRKQEPNRDIFQFPNDFVAAELPLQEWSTVMEIAQFIVGMRSRDAQL